MWSIHRVTFLPFLEFVKRELVRTLKRASKNIDGLSNRNICMMKHEIEPKNLKSCELDKLQ